LIISVLHNDEHFITGGRDVAKRPSPDESSKDRFTVTFAPGQREALQTIADGLNASLAFVVRYALDEFIERHRDKQLRLRFTLLPGAAGNPQED